MIYQNYQVIFPYFYFSAYPLLHKSYFSDGLNQRKNDNLYVCAGKGSTGYETLSFNKFKFLQFNKLETLLSRKKHLYSTIMKGKYQMSKE